MKNTIIFTWLVALSLAEFGTASFANGLRDSIETTIEEVSNYRGAVTVLLDKVVDTQNKVDNLQEKVDKLEKSLKKVKL
jgi:peptidoglycan hydrolase CwlO-like protein